MKVKLTVCFNGIHADLAIVAGDKEPFECRLKHHSFGAVTPIKCPRN